MSPAQSATGTAEACQDARAAGGSLGPQGAAAFPRRLYRFAANALFRTKANLTPALLSCIGTTSAAICT